MISLLFIQLITSTIPHENELQMLFYDIHDNLEKINPGPKRLNNNKKGIILHMRFFERINCLLDGFNEIFSENNDIITVFKTIHLQNDDNKIKTLFKPNKNMITNKYLIFKKNVDLLEACYKMLLEMKYQKYNLDCLNEQKHKSNIVVMNKKLLEMKQIHNDLVSFCEEIIN